MALEILILIAILALGVKQHMNHAQLLALLQQEGAEIQDIGTKVQTLLDTIHNSADSVPQDVQDAANALKTGLDALSTEAGG